MVWRKGKKHGVRTNATVSNSAKDIPVYVNGYWSTSDHRAPRPERVIIDKDKTTGFDQYYVVKNGKSNQALTDLKEDKKKIEEAMKKIPTVDEPHTARKSKHMARLKY